MMEKTAIDIIKTLENLNKEFPRFQLSTLLKIVECIEEKNKIDNDWYKPYYPYETYKEWYTTPNITCTYNNTNNECKNKECKCKKEKKEENNFNYKITKQEAKYENGELVEGKTYINDNGEITKSSVGTIFPPSKKNEGITSHNQKVLTKESDNDNDDEYVKGLIEYLKENIL